MSSTVDNANNGGPDAATIDVSSDNSQGNKRKSPPTNERGPEKKAKAPENRAVFATNIPLDATLEEIEDTFRKAGIIDQGIDGNPRIKMYADEDKKFNGEVLVVYFKKESVQQAIMRIDGWEFRLGDTSNGVVTVQEADMSYKKYADGNEVTNKMVRKDRKAAERVRSEMNRKLAEWSDDEEDFKKAFEPKKNKYAKFVIIKKAFTLEDINDDQDPGALLDIKDDMRTAASKFGEVTNVVLYDQEPEGILTVRFKEFEPAEEFVKAFNGRRYNNADLELVVADDRFKFKKSGRGDDPVTVFEGDVSDGDGR